MALLLLRPLGESDLDAILQLDQTALGGLWSRAGYQRELASPNSDLLGIWSEGSLLGLGCLWAILEEAHITTLAIAPDYQRQGLGQWLLLELLRLAQQRGLERATLEVRESNAAALGLYQKFGFRTAGRRKGYYQDNGEAALICWFAGLDQGSTIRQLADQLTQVQFRLQQQGWRLHENPWQHASLGSANCHF
jgi:ribosomal-protein-alanine N-acetyltransferase